MGQTQKDNRLESLLDMERLQVLLEDLAKALDLAFVMVDYQGRPVIKGCGFTDFCGLLQDQGKNGQLCQQCYAHGGLHAAMTGEPYIYRCHAGLAEFAVPVMMNGKYLGSVIGGQRELAEGSLEPVPVLPRRTPWTEETALSQARTAVSGVSYEKLTASARLVQEILRNLLEAEQIRAVQTELKQKNRELMEEKMARVNLELTGKTEEEPGQFAEKLDSAHLFYMLNVISRLAFLEKAEQTERAACDFAAMMRYVLENEDYRSVTLGEELEYIGYYLQIQQQRTDGRLLYEIHVPENYGGALCPFMLLHPLVENTVKYVLDNSRDGGCLTISGREEQNLLVLAMRCDCVGLTGQQIGQTLDLEAKRRGSPLVCMDQSVKNIFGDKCGITVEDREDGRPGREIQIRLPLSGSILGR